MPFEFRCQAILFDLDGVLVDSNPISERHWRTWAARHALAYAAIADIHHGRPTVETMRHVAPHLPVEDEALAKETAEADDIDGLSAYAGATELLTRLPPQRWAIATSGRRRTAAFRLRHVGLPEPDVLVTADDVSRGKPAPEPYLLAARRLGLDPSDCLVIEDAPAGIASARAAGACVVAVASTNPRKNLTQAHVIIDRLSDLMLHVADDALHLRTIRHGEG